MHLFTRQRLWAIGIVMVAACGSPLRAEDSGDSKSYRLQTTAVESRSSRNGSTEAQRLIERADRTFEAGARQWAEGNTKLAQEAFDQAVAMLVEAPPGMPGRAAISARTERMIEEIYRLAADSSAETSELSFEASPLDDLIDLTFPTDPKLKKDLSEQVRATTSQLPLELADPVVSFINYFQSQRGRNTLRFGLQRMGRYEGMIRRILDEEGVPQELIHLAQAESAFQPRAMSWAAAAGMWQFVRSRGEEYGLKSSALHDDRLDPERATRAAARHLRDLYEEFGDWYLAIAAYNCGPMNVSRAVERSGYADFWELYKRNLLPRETANYLPIILAMTIMTKNPAAYHLEDVVADSALSYESLVLSAPTHLALVADLTDKPLAEIRDMNPAVHKMVAPAGYSLHVPKGSPSMLRMALDGIPADHRASWRVHRVGSEDTIEAIARQYRTTEEKIHDANGEAFDEMEEGDFVIVPVSYPGADSTTKAPTRQQTRLKRFVQKSRATASAKRAVATKTSSKRPATKAATSSKASTTVRKSTSPRNSTVASASRTRHGA
jgi:membrane-bound lytic murein transglycosylase D